MKWTSEKPTEPGWYWTKLWHGRILVVEVARMPSGSLYFYVPDVTKRADDKDFVLWSGPLELPEKP